MIVWTGWGFAVVAMAALCAGLSESVFAANRWAYLVLFTLGAVATWFLGAWLNSRPGRVLVDPATGRAVEYRRRHTLFWVPMQYWGLAMAAGAVMGFLNPGFK